MLSFSKFLAEVSSPTEHHVHVAFMGANPHTHMGHHIDVLGGMGDGGKFVGLSGASTVFNNKERVNIATRQAKGKIKFKVEKTAGQTVGRAFKSISEKPGKKILHFHVGLDRVEFAKGLKTALENNKIPEMNGGKFDEIHIHYPSGKERAHGMSGTKMRKAAADGKIGIYHEHLGSMFLEPEAREMMQRIKSAVESGAAKIKRK